MRLITVSFQQIEDWLLVKISQILEDPGTDDLDVVEVIRIHIDWVHAADVDEQRHQISHLHRLFLLGDAVQNVRTKFDLYRGQVSFIAQDVNEETHLGCCEDVSVCVIFGNHVVQSLWNYLAGLVLLKVDHLEVTEEQIRKFFSALLLLLQGLQVAIAKFGLHGPVNTHAVPPIHERTDQGE